MLQMSDEEQQQLVEKYIGRNGGRRPFLTGHLNDIFDHWEQVRIHDDNSLTLTMSCLMSLILVCNVDSIS